MMLARPALHRSMLHGNHRWSGLNLTATVEEYGSSWQQARTNLGSSPSLTYPTHLCKACGDHFNTRARQHVCVDCRNHYCGRCSVQQEPPHPRLCHTCQHFHDTLFSRTQLMRLKVRELRDYLHLHEVPTQTCREKEELVDLILDQRASGRRSGCDNGPFSSSGLPGDGVATGASSRPDGTSETSGRETPRSRGESQPADNVRDDDEEDVDDDDDDDDEDDDDDDEGDEDKKSDSDESPTAGRRASLSDLSRAEDVEGLSVRQLKEILGRRFVNFEGCCEKWELTERVTRLYNDRSDVQRRERATAKQLEEDDLCRICMDSPIDCVLLECGHMVTCSRCGQRMKECPICRQHVDRAVHVFRS